MHELVRSPVATTIAIATATALTISPATLLEESHPPPTLVSDVSLTATASPPPGALLEQFLVNQVENCSLICPHIIELAIDPAVAFAIIPVTFVQELQSGQPLLQAIARTDATVSGAANDALTGIIEKDLNLVLPRFQHGVEVGVVGLIEVGITAVTQPGNLLQAIQTARSDLIDAAKEPPGPQGPAPVHNELEAGAVRVLEVGFAVTFQAPERLLLGVTQAADAFFTTVGDTGNIGAGLQAVGASVSTTVDESVGLVEGALTRPIPITPKPSATTVAPMTTTAITSGTPSAASATDTDTPAIAPPRAKKAPITQPLTNLRQILRPSAKAGGDTSSTRESSTTRGGKPLGLIHKAEQAVKRAVDSLGKNSLGKKKPAADSQSKDDAGEP